MHNKKIISFLIFITFLGINFSFSQELKELSDTSDFAKIRSDNIGKVVLINFWATWCKPCVAEFPELIKLQKEYKEKYFSLILVSLDFNEDISSKLLPFLKKNDVDFPTYHLDINNADRTEKIMEYFDKAWNGGIPASFIYNKEGEKKYFILGGEEFDYFDKRIKELM